MNSINIKKRRTVQDPRNICLGNGVRITFRSKRIANAFIAETNRFLTKCLVSLNLCYTDLFREYRAAWFIATNTNAGRPVNYRSTIQMIRDELSAADFVLEKFSATAWGSNDPFFAFIDLSKAAGFLMRAGDALAEFNKKRSVTANQHICTVLADRCASINKKLGEYGIELIKPDTNNGVGRQGGEKQSRGDGQQ